MRTKKDIAKDYRTYLKKTLNKPEKIVNEFSDDEIIEIIIEKCYDTEVYDGKKICSETAWFHFINFIIHKDTVTEKPIWNKFVKEVFSMIERSPYTCFMASRGLGKSYITFCLYPLFKTFLFQHTDVLLVTNIPKMAKRNLRVMKRIVDTNEILLEKKDTSNLRELKWGDLEIEYNDGLIETVSIGGTPRSAHVPLVIVDDPLRDDNKYSDEYIYDFVVGQLLPCVERVKGRMVVNGTPQSQVDVFHRIMNENEDGDGNLVNFGNKSHIGFTCASYPAVTDFATKACYLPDVYSWEDLMKIKRIQGDIIFTREYCCKVVSDDSAIFPEYLVKKCTKPDFELEAIGKADKIYVIGVDLASSASKTADYSSFCVLEYDVEKGVKILRALVNEKLTAEEQEDMLMSMARKYNNAFVLVEKNNIGEYIRQKLEANNIFCDGFTTSKESKANAIKFLRTEMANGRIFFPPWEGETAVLRKQLINFGYKQVRGRRTMCALTGHDDAIDALWIANLATQSMDVMPSAAITHEGHNRRR